ncbi:bactofilin family protein [Oceanibacterium hippocampi]|uniref:Polymer-forming cytoskeletal n=1 Tax=Oceanibacterium hippocampi TaxID=745714 RepID=A0A1Y5RIH0_9PROT|nr:polymer-forming cytoskeletal protein [Oceanibacterium hippocampi]SLN18323.1 Polymer-forming cytoskeletal [Oceanibacterium hippocampi]
MFGRKREFETDKLPNGATILGNRDGNVADRSARLLKASDDDIPAMPTGLMTSPLKSNVHPDIPGFKKPLAPGVAGKAGNEGPAEPKTLVVGRDIQLNGEIHACERLVVEGRIEANIKGARQLEIRDGGLFTGSAVVDMAEIDGKFEGDLSVGGKLTIRAKGRVSGTIRYGELEIQAGGQVAGTMEPNTETVAAGSAGDSVGKGEASSLAAAE